MTVDPPHTMADLVRNHATEMPERPALTVADHTVTWAELDAQTSRVAQALAASGVRAGDRVAVLDRNSAEHLEVLLGAAKLGAVTVPVNWRLSAAEVATVLADAGAAVVVIGPGFVDRLAAAGPRLTGAARVVVAGDHPGYPSYRRWVAAHPARDPGVTAPAEDVALQLYTSGTTGRPKGVMLTGANLAAFLASVVSAWRFDRHSVNLVAMPMFHIGGTGYALAGMASGGHTVLIREVDCPAILAALPRWRVTHLFAVPTVLRLLLETPSISATDVSSLRLLLYGGSPMSPELLRRATTELGCPLAQAYGMTETTGAIVMLPPEDHRWSGPGVHRAAAAGRPMSGVRLRVVDPGSGADLPPGHVGEVWAHTRQRMKGYWRQPGETAAVVTPDGWLRTGDAGYLDEDGYLYLHDRITDMIVSGGENVYPAEVEQVLGAHPAVAEVCVFGVPSQRWGETVTAVVVPAGGGGDIAVPDLIGWTRQRLAAYKCPTSIRLVESLPRNASGKVLRRELREPYWRGQPRRVG